MRGTVFDLYAAPCGQTGQMQLTAMDKCELTAPSERLLAQDDGVFRDTFNVAR